MNDYEQAKQSIIDVAMTRIASKPVFNTSCVVYQGLALFSDKWSMLTLMSLMQGRKRYGELQRNLPDISPKMLVQTLRALESNKLITRTIHAEIPPRVEYELTKFGMTLRFPLASLLEWSVEHEQAICVTKLDRETP